MKKSSLISIILSIVNIGCQNSNEISIIKNEYFKFINEEASSVELNEIIILEKQNLSFEELAYHEIDRLLYLNNNSSKIIHHHIRIDSLLKVSIEKRNCLYPNANPEYQLQYENKNRLDSISIENLEIRRLNEELDIANNEVKILEIQKMASDEDIVLSTNCRILHQIVYTNHDQEIIDTAIFVGFNNMKFKYLAKNPLDINK